MAKPKAYQVTTTSLRMKTVEDMLRPGGGRTDYALWVVASTKAEATRMVEDVNLAAIDERDWRLAWDSKATQALRKANLLEREGTILVAAYLGGNDHVVLVDPDAFAWAIGKIGCVHGGQAFFMPTMAQYASKGSVAAGSDDVFIHTGRPEDRRWASTQGYSLSDEGMQELIDAGTVIIVFAGHGEWSQS